MSQQPTSAAAPEPLASGLPSPDAPSPLALSLHPLLHQLLILVFFFSAIAPTLPWLEFAGGMENVTIATALETARDGHWLIPHLHGEPRIKKPPFAHWLGAVGILSSDSFAWGARWPTLLCACILLLSVYHLGRIIGGPSIALAAAFVCGSSMIFLRYARYAAYDMPLAMWVGIAYVCIAMAIFQRRWWLGCCGAGIALGLAILTKGPIALLQTLIPAAIFLLLERLSGRRLLPDRFPFLPLLVGMLLMLLVALPWYIYFMAKIPTAWEVWTKEVVNKDEQLYEKPDPWYNYLQFIPAMAPWAIWLVVGMIALVAQHPYKNNHRPGLAFLWLAVPMLIMSFTHTKRTRYLLPLISPAAVLAAWGLLVHLPGWLASKGIDKLLVTIHWLLLAVLVVGLAVIGTAGWFDAVSVEGQPWYSLPLAGGFVILAGFIILASALLYRRWTGSLVLGSTIAMLLLNAMFLWGYRQCSNARSEGRLLAQRILAIHPEAKVFSYHPAGLDPPLDVPVYLNRVVHKVPDPSKVLPAPYPQMIIIHTESRESPPATPPGCRYIENLHIRKDYWYLYEMPAIPQQ